MSSFIAGIDVSHYNGTIDWAAAARNASFAFIKATEGVHMPDPRFRANWQGAKDAGILRGAYHFFSPKEDGASQADYFLKSIDLAVGDLPPVLDLETAGAENPRHVAGEAACWVSAVQAATGRAPIIYTTASFWRQIGNPPNPAGCRLWVAHYGVPAPALPHPWEHWTFWQFSQTGSCAGISGAVDTNHFQGTSEDLRALTIPEK